MNETIEAEVVESRIVICRYCGQENRVYVRKENGVHRCGKCKADLFAVKLDRRFTRFMFVWLVMIILGICGAGLIGKLVQMVWSPAGVPIFILLSIWWILTGLNYAKARGFV